MIIAIDGPAGSGKSTVAKLCARQLGFRYVDTGAMYRAVALYVLDKGLDSARAEVVEQAAQVVDFNNIDEDRIRSVDVSRVVSEVAKYPGVRQVAVLRQREFATKENLIMEGRDIGSVVFPDAELKVYLNASVSERAIRRYNELVERGETAVSREKIKQDIILRDKTDMEREISPLRKLPDALDIDTTGLSINDVVGVICGMVDGVVNSE